MAYTHKNADDVHADDDEIRAKTAYKRRERVRGRTNNQNNPITLWAIIMDVDC